MSLVDFVATPPVRELFARYLPRGGRRLPEAALRVPLEDTRLGGAVGTAFDYMLRFRLLAAARLACVPARSGPWVAETSVSLLERQGHPEAPRWRRILAAARALEAAVAAGEEVEPRRIAVCSQYLGAADLLVRTGAMRADFRESQGVTEQLLALDRATDPKPLLPAEGPLLLNPALSAGESVGGADPDLVSGDCVLDVKTTVRPAADAQRLRQVCGYAALCHVEPGMHEVRRVGFLFPRQGILVRYGLDELFDGRWEEARDSFLELTRIKS